MGPKNATGFVMDYGNDPFAFTKIGEFIKAYLRGGQRVCASPCNGGIVVIKRAALFSIQKGIPSYSLLDILLWNILPLYLSHG